MRALTVSAFRKNLKKHLDAVIDDQDIIVIPRDNGDGDGKGIVVMPLSQYNSQSATDRINASPANRSRLLEAIERLNDGEYTVIDPTTYEGRIRQDSTGGSGVLGAHQSSGSEEAAKAAA